MSAIFTINKTFNHFVPVWEKYYKQFFDEVVMLTDDTPDGVDVYEKFVNITGVLRKKQIELLTRHDVVAYAEIDEIFMPDPEKFANLSLYVDWFKREPHVKAVSATGMNVVQMMDEEPIDWSKPVLPQRTHWTRDPFYDKCFMSKGPTHWDSGMMNFGADKGKKDEYFYLIHLKYIDYEQEVERGRERRGYKTEQAFKNQFDKVQKGATPMADRFKIV